MDLTNNRLYIFAENKRKSKDEVCNLSDTKAESMVLNRDERYKRYRRIIRLPVEVDESKVCAKSENGKAFFGPFDKFN